MQPSSNERAPPWSCSRSLRPSCHSAWTTTRVAVVLLSFLLLVAVLSAVVFASTRTLTRTSAVEERLGDYSKDEQLQKYKSELRAMTKRLERQLRALEQRPKREALEPSTSSHSQTSSTPIPKSTTSRKLADATVQISNTTVASNSSIWTTTGRTVEPSTVTAHHSNSTSNITEISNHITVTSPSSSTAHQTAENSTNTTSSPLVASAAINLPVEANNVFHLQREFSGPLQNASHCVQFTEEQLVKELKQHGTYNPDFMAWDVRGVLNFFERASTDNYDKLRKSQDRAMTVEQNLAAVEQLVKELNLQNCNLRTPDVLARLYNLSSTFPRGASSLDSLSFNDYGRLRTKRDDSNGQDGVDPTLLAKAKYIYDSYKSGNVRRDEPLDAKGRSSGSPWKSSSDNDGIVGQVHVVPSGCRKRGSSEDGYLRLCSACQAIRRLPDTFFPPFLNEVTCDEDKACLYFYDYPHGKCRQKHLNLVVLKNVGTADCQLWKRYNLNVRVSCECFVDEMSFFAKYV